jgi:DNA-binding MarR family transcriptional regulator
MTRPRAVATGAGRKGQTLAEEIVGRLVRRHSIATVLFHHAVAERLGLGPWDHKCLDLLRERGTMTGSDLTAITHLTSGAITGVVARLERAGYIRREPDPHDRRRQILRPVVERMRDIHQVFDPIRKDVTALLESFDTHQLTAIAEFLARSTDVAYRHVALLRAPTPDAPGRTAATRETPGRDGKKIGPKRPPPNVRRRQRHGQ